MHGNIVLLDNGLCLWHNARESAESGGTILQSIIMLSILKDPMEGLNPYLLDIGLPVLRMRNAFHNWKSFVWSVYMVISDTSYMIDGFTIALLTAEFGQSMCVMTSHHS